MQVIGGPSRPRRATAIGISDRPESLSIDAAVAGTAGLVLEALAERRALEDEGQDRGGGTAPTRGSRWTARGSQSIEAGFQQVTAEMDTR